MRLLHLILALTICAFAASAQDVKKTTRNLLSRFGDDLTAAWTEYPQDKQKVVRDQKVVEVNNAFTKDLPSAELPPNLNLQRAVDGYFDHLKRTETLLKPEKMKAERTLYLTACQSVFKREFMAASDLSANRTTQQTFDWLLDTMESAREKLRLLGTDAQSQAYASINSVFAEMLKSASVPKQDPTAQFDANLKEVQRRFPTGNPALEKVNKPIATILEAAAKSILQLAVKK